MDIVIRAAVVFVFLVLALNVIGRRELSQMSPFDLLLLVVVGDLVQQGITQDDYSVTAVVLVVATFGLMQILLSYLNFRVSWLRPLLQGEPIVIVQDGKLLEENMRRERLTRGDVLEQARLQQLPTLDDVRWAVLEPSGQISFITSK